MKQCRAGIAIRIIKGVIPLTPATPDNCTATNCPSQKDMFTNAQACAAGSLGDIPPASSVLLEIILPAKASHHAVIYGLVLAQQANRRYALG